MIRTILIFAWVYAAMIAMAFWESYSEKRNAWDRGKAGWKIKIGSFTFTAYHFYLYYVMFPFLMTLPLVVTGWDTRLFGILLSAYFSGTTLEDFMWYVVNPQVRLKELYTDFSDYYPWIKIAGKKIIPWGYLLSILVAVAAWLIFWR